MKIQRYATLNRFYRSNKHVPGDITLRHQTVSVMKIRPGFFNTCVKIKPKRFFEKSTITLTEVSHTNSSTRFVFSLSVVNTGVTCDQVQFLTHERIHAYAHSAQRRVHLATPSAIDGRFSPHDKSKESPMLPSTVRCLLVSPPVNPPERAQG